MIFCYSSRIFIIYIKANSKKKNYTGKQNETKPIISNCPRCKFVNAIENKYCSNGSYHVKPEAYDEIKSLEEKQQIEILQQKYKMI